ncbi:hypothetical protein Y032_0081g1461 [Ancylostoma ceylanicum]|uniref:Uncharacterized protein n=1 Tax=Ancylostoma ceylanicum TaxID=53326 RepID=A0A016TT94_9BILA|nr:hypothetical protein Y032_0081g1461 [Ancylostoma ceylanicum]
MCANFGPPSFVTYIQSSKIWTDFCDCRIVAGCERVMWREHEPNVCAKNKSITPGHLRAEVPEIEGNNQLLTFSRTRLTLHAFAARTPRSSQTCGGVRLHAQPLDKLFLRSIPMFSTTTKILP